MDGKAKYEQLKKEIKPLGRVVVAFSGGVDSTLLLKTCVDVLGRENVLALIGDSESYPQKEVEEAIVTARQIGTEYEVIKTCEMEDANFRENTKERCYYCKRHLFGDALRIAQERGFAHVLEGSNSDDRADYRPGRRAIAELGALSPLLVVNLTKEEIRSISKVIGLSTHNKPSYACLASRIPYGTTISPELLKRIELAEELIRNMGIGQVRVRFHANVARIEVPADDFDTIMEHRDEIARGLRECGFLYVTLDLEGYRTGSMNEVL